MNILLDRIRYYERYFKCQFHVRIFEWEIVLTFPTYGLIFMTYFLPSLDIEPKIKLKMATFKIKSL